MFAAMGFCTWRIAIAPIRQLCSGLAEAVCGEGEETGICRAVAGRLRSFPKALAVLVALAQAGHCDDDPAKRVACEAHPDCGWQWQLVDRARIPFVEEAQWMRCGDDDVLYLRSPYVSPWGWYRYARWVLNRREVEAVETPPLALVPGSRLVRGALFRDQQPRFEMATFECGRPLSSVFGTGQETRSAVSVLPWPAGAHYPVGGFSPGTEYAWPEHAERVAVTRDGRWVLASCARWGAALWERGGGGTSPRYSLRRRVPIPLPLSLGFARSGNTVFAVVGSKLGMVTAVDTRRRSVWSYRFPRHLAAVRTHYDVPWIVAVDVAASIYVLRPTIRGLEVIAKQGGPPDQPTCRVAVWRDTALLGWSNGRIEAYRLPSLEVLWSVRVPGQRCATPVFSPDGTPHAIMVRPVWGKEKGELSVELRRLPDLTSLSATTFRLDEPYSGWSAVSPSYFRFLDEGSLLVGNGFAFRTSAFRLRQTSVAELPGSVWVTRDIINSGPLLLPAPVEPRQATVRLIRFEPNSGQTDTISVKVRRALDVEETDYVISRPISPDHRYGVYRPTRPHARQTSLPRLLIAPVGPEGFQASYVDLFALVPESLRDRVGADGITYHQWLTPDRLAIAAVVVLRPADAVDRPALVILAAVWEHSDGEWKRTAVFDPIAFTAADVIAYELRRRGPDLLKHLPHNDRDLCALAHNFSIAWMPLPPRWPLVTGQSSFVLPVMDRLFLFDANKGAVRTVASVGMFRRPLAASGSGRIALTEWAQLEGVDKEAVRQLLKRPDRKISVHEVFPSEREGTKRGIRAIDALAGHSWRLSVEEHAFPPRELSLSGDGKLLGIWYESGDIELWHLTTAVGSKHQRGRSVR